AKKICKIESSVSGVKLDISPLNEKISPVIAASLLFNKRKFGHVKSSQNKNYPDFLHSAPNIRLSSRPDSDGEYSQGVYWECFGRFRLGSMSSPVRNGGDTVASVSGVGFAILAKSVMVRPLSLDILRGIGNIGCSESPGAAKKGFRQTDVGK
ncbi:MAG: hypothetical protein ACOCVL_03175, partial [Candidatus Sumerlaeota bacterium]